MPARVLTRSPDAEQRAIRPETSARPTPTPPSDLESLKADGNSFIFDSFTVQDAWILGNLLRSRLLPFPTATLISIALANGTVIFQTATGSGVVPDNEIWVQRKRNTVLRWGNSSWFMHCKYDGDEAAFKAKSGMSEDQASKYSIHGGAVPIHVQGVEGVVAVVVVSGLKQHEDHGVIADVIRENWQ
ncbi:hypothetical protein VPNG_05862 [Cytospora leucostoma]|uniref:DUF967 domain protein n=1 Tax=Cytospora leucostoma TaxID=1230097 RepID=A0A423X0N8_9PEZI|nr:hypothetical protein VPNG_05862 [Cytospora leucostoma]